MAEAERRRQVHRSVAAKAKGAFTLAHDTTFGTVAKFVHGHGVHTGSGVYEYPMMFIFLIILFTLCECLIITVR